MEGEREREREREEVLKSVGIQVGQQSRGVGGGNELVVSLCQEDPLYEKKKKLLCGRGFGPEFGVFLSPSQSPTLTLKLLLQASRIIHSDELELYFAGLDALHFYTPRNELQSLNSILSLIHSSSLNCTAPDKLHFLQLLRDATMQMITQFGLKYDRPQILKQCTCLPENHLLHWAQHHGLKTKLQIAHVQGAGRGAMAVQDLNVGDTALEIPQSLIISDQLVYHSHMFHILKELDNISLETMLLLWSMKERYNSESKYKIFFDTLPETFSTGLSFGIEALAALEETLLFEEIIQAKEHLRMQYEALCPALCNKHPDIFEPDLYTWERFLWACELWYSNSMKVMFTDGKLKTCLVPVAGLLNHSLCPHILHYGRVDSASKSLKFSVSRPCREGEQCCLSYGNLPSSHLVTFYGFLPKGENLYDVIPLDIEAPQPDGIGGCPESDWNAHMVRGTWLSSRHELFYYGLPSPLLNYLRAILSGSKLPMEPCMNTENEVAVLETLCSIFNPMLEGLGVSENVQRENFGWDVKLALEFKDLQRRIISSVLASCSAGLEMLQQHMALKGETSTES